MKKLVLALVVMALLASLGAAQYRDPVFLAGGYGSTSTYYQTGLWVMDGNNKTMTSLFPAWMKPYSIYNAQMDVDNKSVIFMANSTTSSTYNVKNGLFRFDPTTQLLTTIVQANYPSNGPMYYGYRIGVTQNGDYVFGCYGRVLVNSRTQTEYHILKHDKANGLTTLFTSYNLNNQYARAYFSGALGTDIDSGNILANLGTGTSSTLSPFGYYAWIGIDPNTSGKFSTFAAGLYGTYYGRNQSYSKVQQDYATGEIHDPYYQQVYVQKPGYGMGGYTTLWNWGYPGGFYWRYAGLHDLQSAPNKRYANTGYFIKTQTSPTTLTYYTSAFGYKTTSPVYGAMITDMGQAANNGRRYGATVNGYALDWWQGRNIQSVMTGPNKWQLRFSCPNHAKKRYFAVIGQSGIRPGIPLPSGRTIWINFDVFVFLSLNNILLPFFSAGPGILDANGEAQGFLNTALVAPLNGATVHIAMMVMDAAAPDGISFIPDTYVMKLP